MTATAACATLSTRPMCLGVFEDVPARRCLGVMYESATREAFTEEGEKAERGVNEEVRAEALMMRRRRQRS
jgi:hypothetical protein